MSISGKFWYSEKQKQAVARNARFMTDSSFSGLRPRPPRELFARLNDGRVVEYTEMMTDDRKSAFDDAVYLGEGEFSHAGEITGER